MIAATPLDRQLVFDRFVVGTGNRLAAAAARRTAESPGRSYNPLVVTGAPGLGKTHLLTAIGHLARAVEPESVIHYEGIETFVDRLTDSIAAGTVDELREARGSTDIWLLDDLQNVGGKSRTQEELLRIWETMIQRGAQVVVAVDRPLTEVPGLDPRVASRLAGGLTVEINAPDPATRLGIILQIVSERGFPLPTTVVEALADLPIPNVRELQGGLNRVVAAVEIEGRPADAAMVASLLGLDGDPRAISEDEFGGFLADISNAVAAVVETAPWRRRVAESILRWGGEGVRTRRLEAALDADSAPDVDALLRGFARDVVRMRELARTLPAPPADPLLVTDPDRLADLEALVGRSGGSSVPRPAPRPPEAAGPASLRVDPWFLDRGKFAWDWLALDERIIEEQR